MRAISLTQPWATLVATGDKTIETRSWFTSYRGPIAIHAARTMPGWVKDLCRRPLFERTLQEAGYAPPHWPQDRCLERLPRGAVVCTAELIDCIRTEEAKARGFVPPESPEFDFGDYTDGRWAWLLANVRPFFKPIPATGTLGLWEWGPPV